MTITVTASLIHSYLENATLDAIRFFATFGVISLHLVGGIETLQLSIGNRLVINSILAVTYTSVNLFGVLSGYLKIDRTHHNASLLKIVLTTIFWCFLITLICFFGLNTHSAGDLLTSAFPFLGDRLWYITCYGFVFLCAPYLNFLLNHLSKVVYKRLLVILFLLMAVLPTVFYRDIFHVVNKGYSAGWLIFMYLIGGYLKKYESCKRYNNRLVFITLVTSLCFVIASKYVLEKFLTKVGMNVALSWQLYYYNSPFTVLNTICIFCLLKNIAWKKNMFGKLISWLSTVSLGVYVIHAHPYSLDHVLIGKNLTWAVNDNPLITLMILLGTILGIYFGLGFLEQVRLMLFRNIGVNAWIKKEGEKLDKIMIIDSQI